MADEGANTGEAGVKAASDRIREAAKWLTITLGTVGALLLAGTSLSSIGSLEPWSARFIIALVGGAVAAVGAVVVLVASVKTATTPIITLSELAGDTPPEGTASVLRDPLLLGDYDDVKALARAYDDETTARRAAIDDYKAHPDDDDKKTIAFRKQAKATEVGVLVSRMLAMSSFEHLKWRWKRSLQQVLVGGVAAGVGVVMFVWAANPPADAEGTTFSPALIATAKSALLQLNASGQRALSEAADCDLSKPIDVLKVGTAAGGPDVVIDAEGCKPVRAIITPAWGTVTMK